MFSELHPRIAKQELDYIKNELLNTLSEKPKPIPWKSILTSIPLWGMIITDMGNCVGIMTLGSYGPSYLKYMLGVDIKTNGFLSGLPMLTRYLGGLFHAAIADYLFTKRDWSVLWVRRVFNSICMCGPAIGKINITNYCFFKKYFLKILWKHRHHILVTFPSHLKKIMS